jgi:hypothetical protein
MVTIVRKKVTNLAIMADIALPGSGEEELCTGIRVFFQQKDTMPGHGSL